MSTRHAKLLNCFVSTVGMQTQMEVRGGGLRRRGMSGGSRSGEPSRSGNEVLEQPLQQTENASTGSTVSFFPPGFYLAKIQTDMFSAHLLQLHFCVLSRALLVDPSFFSHLFNALTVFNSYLNSSRIRCAS